MMRQNMENTGQILLNDAHPPLCSRQCGHPLRRDHHGRNTEKYITSDEILEAFRAIAYTPFAANAFAAATPFVTPAFTADAPFAASTFAAKPSKSFHEASELVTTMVAAA